MDGLLLLLDCCILFLLLLVVVLLLRIIQVTASGWLAWNVLLNAGVAAGQCCWQQGALLQDRQ